jgi:hypothetical protein
MCLHYQGHTVGFHIIASQQVLSSAFCPVGSEVWVVLEDFDIRRAVAAEIRRDSGWMVAIRRN